MEFFKIQFFSQDQIIATEFWCIILWHEKKNSRNLKCAFLYEYTAPLTLLNGVCPTLKSARELPAKCQKCKFKFYFCAFMDINCHVFMTVKCNGFYYILCLLQVSSAKKVCVPCVPCGECQSTQ